MNNMVNSVETESIGRRPDGRFAAGNRAAAGHKRRQHVAKLRAAFTSCLTEDDIANVVSKLLEVALGGDVQAIKLLLERSIGKPEAFDDLPEELGSSESPAEPTKITAENFDVEKERLLRRIALLGR
jgi:hypothetical protein